MPAAEHPVLVSDVVRLEEARGDGRHQRWDAVGVQVHLSAEAVRQSMEHINIKIKIYVGRVNPISWLPLADKCEFTQPRYHFKAKVYSLITFLSDKNFGEAHIGQQ